MGRLVIAAALVLAGCGVLDGNDGCSEPHGVYVVTLAEIAGDCGPVSEPIVSNVDAPSPGCSVMPGVRDEKTCSGAGTVICVESDGTRITSTLTLDWDRRATFATGTMTISISGPGGSCSGTYSVTYRK